MNKTTYIKSAFIAVLLLLNFYSYAQTYKPFTVRENLDVKGSMLVIGNNILGQDNLPFNDLTKDNQDVSMQYVDIDGDSSTFSSSSANLLLSAHQDGSATTCYRVAYAALYWAATLQSGNRANINQVKLKVPGSSTYTNITGEVIYDAIVNPIIANTNEPGNTPYACYADITDIMSGLSGIEGTYTVANVTSSLGLNNSTGLSAGWTLFVIYEDPLLHTKSFTTFDGFSHIYDGHQETVPVTGFTTPPSPSHIDLQFAYATLDGDRTKRATKLEINGKEVTTPLRPANKFFGSVIENTNGVSNPRNPMSDNTLGYDTGFLEILNSEPEFIKNNQSSADFRLQVARGQADPIFAFFSAFAVDIIAPDIELTKVVLDTSGNDIDGADVNLGQYLFYEISYQSVGNDNVTQFTIKDVLPDNILFDPLTDIDLTNAGGATLQSYDPVTRTLIFNIPDASVEVNDPRFVIRLAVRVVPNCYDLSQACSNEIMNQAFATYRGVINPTIIQDEGSFATTECLGVPGSTNFLVDISNCTFEKNEVLCGPSVLLKAADGYDTYSWSTSPTGTPVIGTGQTYTATSTGTYYVNNTTSATCISIQERITVIPYGNTITNPVIPYADKVVICPNDGKQLPYIFLCGINDTRAITTGISDAVSIIWQKLDETSCSALTIDDCANESPDCIWNQVATGPNYTVAESGQFRIVINYPGGCFSIFYFNVYQNLLNPTATAKDIICTTPGEITVGGVPSGYEYSVDGTNFQSSNVFTINTPGYYVIYIRQVGVDTNPCIFQTPSVYVRQRDFTVSSIVTQPNCNGDKGSVHLAANDALPQYYFSISQGGTLVNSVGPIMASDYTFANLNPGVYTYTVSTDDGCTFTDDLEIINPPVLTTTVALTRPLTCTDGELTVYPVGGTPPYNYYVNSTTVSQDSPIISVPTAGVYDILVIDFNGCSATTSITVESIDAPIYSVSQTDILCYGDNAGEIQFNVTNANGYAITYSIDNGVTYSSNPTFSNLGAGTYSTNIKYSLNGIECFSSVQDITITQPDSAVTASGGVSELAGCGPSGEGRVRITNPQGGTPPYEYSFDNQATWVTTNEAYVAPGTYTLYIRDANGCIYAMPGIVLDPEPVAPTIDISSPDFNCDGTANATVTVTNSGSNTYTYGYLLDGVENTNIADPKTFLDVPQGSHTISVTYQLQSVPTYSNLLNEDFGSGNPTTTSGIASAYCFNDQRVNAPYPCGTRSVEDNQYSVASFFWRSDDPMANNTGAWYHFKDHTTNGADPNGRFLLVNIGSAAGPYGVLYSKPINDVIPNQDIKVELYLANLMRTIRSDRDDPDFRIQLVDGSGNVIAEQYTGLVPKNEQWNFNTVTLNPGNNTNLNFVIRSGSVQYYGNDALIDDIKVYQLPKACIEQVDFPFIVGSGNAFTADITATDIDCNAGADGTITISAQNFDPSKGFQYSIDNGATWNTQMTSPYTITGLAASSYTVLVRYEDAADTCSLTFNQDIIAPTLLGVTASGTPVTCLDGSTVTVTATGGSPAYSYELLDTSLNLVANFPSNGILTNVSAGDYTIRATDANGCSAITPLSLVAPTPPTASITNADYCYDAVNGATLEVTATGGQAPYEYSINSGAFQSSNVFANLTPGTYDITVRDAYGCTFTLPTETIANQLTATAILVKGLDCTLTPNAEMNVTVNGGTGPFNYEVSFNGGGYTPITLPYTSSIDGNYQFRVTDASGCQALTNVLTIQPITNPSATAAATDVFCNSENSGIVVIDVDETLGIPPYQISFNGSLFTSQTVYNGLTAGSYNYTVRDSNSCEFNGVATINEPSTITLGSEVITPITCGGSGNVLGSISISNVTGGTPNYTYTLLNSSGGFATTSSTNPLGPTSNDNVTFNDLAFGNYYLRVIDTNGCEYNFGPYLVASDVDELDIVVNASGSCSTGVDYDIHIVNGVGPYRVRIYDGSTTFTAADGVAPNGLPTSDTSPNERNHQFSGLQFDVSYVFEVLDTSTNCTYIKQIPAEPNPSGIMVTGTPTNVTCYALPALDNGAFGFTVSSYTGTTLSWEVFNSLTNTTTGITGNAIGLSGADYSDSVTGLASGDYYLFIEETDLSPASNECTTAVGFRIAEPTELLLAEVVNTNANCNQDAQVAVNASGGTPPYEYAFVEDGTSPNIGDWTTNNLVFLDYTVNTNWDVYVRDSNGCTIGTPMDVTITADSTPSITLPTLANDQCISSGNSYTFTATPGGGEVAPVSYSIDGVNFQSSPTFIVSSNGTYTVTIRDGNGCTATDAITIYPVLNINLSLTTLPSCTDDDGVITVTSSGGSGNYSYSINPNLGSISISGNIISGAPSGTYTVTITDTTTLCTKDANITLDAATPVTFTTMPTDVSCNGGSDGIIMVNLPVSNDNPIYTYEIIAPIVVAPQTSNVFTGLAAGTYTVQVTSGRNCIATEDVVVGEPNAISVPAPTVVDYACTAGTNTTNFASITVTGVSGGSGTYTNYEFIRGGTRVQFGSNNMYTELDFLGGTYTINVYDNKGCLGTTTATINPYIKLESLDVTINNAITCTNDEDITVSVTSTGGTPNLEYTLEDFAAIIPTQTNNTGVFTALPIGNYIITVTNLDTGCSLQTAHYVNNPNTFDLTIDSVIDVTCFADNNGSVNVTFIDRTPIPTDESGPFSYTVVDALGAPVTSGSSPNAGPLTLNGFAAGIYTITATLTNTPFCSVTKNFTITAPTAALGITETHTEITCVSGNNDGTISASATGGWPGGYQYQLALTSGTVISAYSSEFNFTGLTAGDYTVSVRDSKNCVATVNVVLTNPLPIDAVATPSTTLLSCFGDKNATISVNNVTGGQGGNYTYTLNMTAPTVSSSGPQISPVFSGLGEGTYNVTVTDGYNCEFTTTDVVISEPSQIVAALVKASTQTCFTDATLTLSATGGTGMYEYSATANFATILGTFASSSSPISVTPGTYSYYVRDANACIASVSNEITIDTLQPLEVNLDTTNATINCAGESTGVIVATAQGGLGNYVYTLQDSSGTDIPGAVQNSPGVFTELPAGMYQVYVESGDCEETSAIVDITDDNVPLTAQLTITDIVCNGSNDGMVEISASGGTGIIKYAISPQLNQFFDEPLFDNLAPGDYQIIVQDELGCYELYDVTITEPLPVVLTIVPNSIFPEACSGDLDGEFSIDISGGNMPYSVSLDDIDGVYTTGAPTQTQFDFTNLAGGDHIVYIRDALGCESEWNITFPESVLIEPEVEVVFGCDNNISTNTVTVTVDASTVDLTDLDYSLDGGTYQTSNIFTDVPAGTNHVITVRHTNGCEKPTQPFDIEPYTPLALAIDMPSGGTLNEIVATATGGSGDYEFTLNGESYGSTNTFLIYESGTYTVTVTDSYGCFATATQYFEFVDICIPNYFTPNNDGDLDEWGPGCASQYRNLKVNIFDRYGRKVATLNVGSKWDGKYNGIELPTGDYWYVVKLNDKNYDREFVGHFTLYR